MDGMTAPGDRNLDTIHQLDRVLVRCSTRRRQASGVVVIGECERFDPALCGAAYQSFRSQGAVGAIRMAVKIEIEQVELRKL